MKTTGLSVLIAGAVISAMVLWVGCESSSTGDDVILNVTPAASTVRVGTLVTFTASLPEGVTNSAVYFPLEWNMLNPSAGRFLETVGNTAIYHAIAPGGNTITVRDRAAHEGSASVVQN